MASFWRFSVTANSLPSASLTTSHSPLAPRSTPHAPPSAGTSGVRSCADPPPLATLTPTAALPRDRTGPALDERPLSTNGRSILLCHRTGRFLRKNQTVLPHSPPPHRRPFSRGRRRSTPVAPGVPAGWPSGAMPVLCLLSLIPPSSPKQLGMVSPELKAASTISHPS